MCGIYGFINTRTDNNFLDLFQDIGIDSESRGVHATGFYGVNNNNDIITAKAPLRATEFFKTPDFTDIKNQHFPILIGHNRWYTHGDPAININNHPFTTTRFGFIHNGVVGSVDISDEDIKLESECDSEMIFRYFLKKFYNNHCDHYAALKKTMIKFDRGSFACALVDSKTQDLYLFLNSGRAISYIVDKEYGLLVFASEENFIIDALKENKIKLKGKIQNLSCGQIVKISKDLKIENETAPVEKPIVKHSTNHNLKRYSFGLNTDQAPWRKSIKTVSAPWKTSKKSWKDECLASGTGVICNICFKKGTVRKFLDADYAKRHVSKEHGILNADKLEESIRDLSAERKEKENNKPKTIWSSKLIWR